MDKAQYLLLSRQLVVRAVSTAFHRSHVGLHGTRGQRVEFPRVIPRVVQNAKLSLPALTRELSTVQHRGTTPEMGAVAVLKAET